MTKKRLLRHLHPTPLVKYPSGAGGCVNRKQFFLFTVVVPLSPPHPNQQSDGFPLEFLLKGPQTNPPKIANKQKYDQTGVSVLNHRGTKIRVFLLRFGAPFLPPFFRHSPHSFPFRPCSLSHHFSPLQLPLYPPFIDSWKTPI